MGRAPNLIDRSCDGYSSIVKMLVRRAVLGIIFLGLAIVGTGDLLTVTPSGFLPEEDQGAFFMEMQLPEGASLNRSLAVAERVERIVAEAPGVATVSTVLGYSFLNGLNQSNAGVHDRVAEAVR